MSLALKFTSLAIRTLAKPIANFIKRQAREHDGFRRTCITFAQRLHRIDMRWRIGLLQDAAAIEKQAAKEAAQDAARKHKHSIPTVKTEAQTKAEEEAAAKAPTESTESPKARSKPKIRPLTEAKAIDAGASFISEAFLFGVAASLILLESWRSRRKESSRRDDVNERLNDLEETEDATRRALIELEREVLRLRAKEQVGSQNTPVRILPPEIYEEKEEGIDEKPGGWFTRISSWISQEKADLDAKAVQAGDLNGPGPAETLLVESEKALEEKRRHQANQASQVSQGAVKAASEDVQQKR
ncbi:hypothetical protein A1O3_09322 [Capronia epimyces CBS 606.96]|uniref:OPA3-like protein n=1 Tax=Capronia epimyces CBS 606.96 TaxID=1182542 RepID=W9XMF2_9EURO|nr:uncharacterized protein A1O3_09322 [Capronia epimyces CBS 606.96]EXJ78161.1 hypothetical protein A1O3_09322 [Capronia epimyces CBS 606.96]